MRILLRFFSMEVATETIFLAEQGQALPGINPHRARRIGSRLPLGGDCAKQARTATRAFPGSSGPTDRGRRPPRMCFGKIRVKHLWETPPLVLRRTSRKTRSSVCCKSFFRTHGAIAKSRG